METTQTLLEIKPSEFLAHNHELRGTLQHICEGTAFRTSPKSCEFLRHIVGHTLAGRADELKERLIGMSLLGRDASYDTGSDAGVRVRANEVRKRLSTHYSTLQKPDGLFFELPVGSYVPKFFHLITPEEQAPSPKITRSDETFPTSLPPLSLYQLAGPTLVMLFLCIMCMRWQVAQEHPFTSFWGKIFESHSSVLYLPEATYGSHGSITEIQAGEIHAMRTAAPLLNLAGQFHTAMKIVNARDADAAQNSVLIAVGESETGMERDRSAPAESSESASGHPPSGWRLVLASTPDGERVVDTAAERGSSASLKMPSHAALLTIVNDASHAVHIDGTDEESISGLVELLCGRDTFPAYINDPFQAGTVVQVLFPTEPSSTALIFRQPLHADGNTVHAGGLQ